MFDVSNADKQVEFRSGPIPSDSIVVVQMDVLEPIKERQYAADPYIFESKNGLLQIYCQFTVSRGEYAGVSFRQNITLPLAAQRASLDPNQETACRIGASQLKALLTSAGKSPRFNKVTDLTGLRFPVKVKINKRSREVNGREYWNNEIALVITPDMPEYAEVKSKGEIINPKGAVTGPASAKGASSSGSYGKYSPAAQTEIPYDEVPF